MLAVFRPCSTYISCLPQDILVSTWHCLKSYHSKNSTLEKHNFYLITYMEVTILLPCNHHACFDIHCKLFGHIIHSPIFRFRQDHVSSGKIAAKSVDTDQTVLNRGLIRVYTVCADIYVQTFLEKSILVLKKKNKLKIAAVSVNILAGDD